MSNPDHAAETGSLKAVRVVLFDAVGTVLYGRPDATNIYHRFGTEFGSQLSQDEVESRFYRALATHHQQPAESGEAWSTSPQAEYDRWWRIVSDVFGDVDDCELLFEKLWDYFGQSSSWAVFDDVAEAWTLLEQRGFELGLASNFDQRLEVLASSLSPLDRTKFVFHSAALGYRKPGALFFRKIEEQLEVEPAEILLVGDSFDCDYLAAREAGWCACWLRRGHPSAALAELSDLRQLGSLIASD